MNKKIKLFFQITLVILLVSGLGYYFYLDYQKSRIPKDERTETIRQIATLTIVKTDLGEEAKNNYQRLFDTQAKIFSDSPESAEAFWALIKIEQIKQIVDDYDGAKQALIWATELQPKSYLANGNLANLYFRHYQDFAKAEEYFLRAVSVESSQAVYYYMDLHEIYRYFYKQNTGLAEDILKQGIEKYPQETNLMAVLANYYKDLNRKEEARQYYQKILAINPNSEVAKKGLKDLE